MSNLWPRWTGFPPELFERGIVLKMRLSSVLFYMFLCRTQDRKSSLQFTLTDADITKQTGLSAGALRTARLEVSGLGLATCERVPGSIYTYTLCDVKAGRPFPGDQKTKQPYERKTKGPSGTKSAAKESPSSTKPDPARTEPKTVGNDTSFNYGHNLEDEKKIYFAPDFFK